MIMPNQKNLTIQTLRGIAILLVVIGHVIGSDPYGGMRIDFPSSWRYLYIWIDYIQMPLFTAIAGWVYALKPITGSFSSFTVGKFKRLIIPLVFVATTYFLVQYFTPGTNNKEVLSSIWRIYIFPYTMYWYLQALFLIFIVVGIVEKLSLMKSASRWLVCLGVAYLFYIAQITLIAGNTNNIFSFQGMLNQLLYFIAGIGVYRFGKELYVYKYVYIVLVVIGLGLLQVKWFYPDLYPELYKCLLPMWVVPTVFLILKAKFTNSFFVYMGGYAYTIYLFHGFGTAGGRIILRAGGIHSEVLIFIFATFIAVVVPIMIGKVLSKNGYTRMIFLGKR